MALRPSTTRAREHRDAQRPDEHAGATRARGHLHACSALTTRYVQSPLRRLVARVFRLASTPTPPPPVLAIALDVGKGVLVQVIARASERVLARDFPRVLPVILRGLHRAGHQKRDQEPRAHAGRWRGGETRAGTHQEAAAGAPAHGAEGRHPRVLVLGVRRAVAHGVQGRLAGLALQGATRVSRRRAAGGGVAAAAGVSGIGAVGGRSKVAQAYVYIII